MIVIVPNYVRDAINAKLDDAIAACPAAASEREAFFHELLVYFNEHGVLPNITIQSTVRHIEQ